MNINQRYRRLFLKRPLDYDFSQIIIRGILNSSSIKPSLTKQILHIIFTWRYHKRQLCTFILISCQFFVRSQPKNKRHRVHANRVKYGAYTLKKRNK